MGLVPPSDSKIWIARMLVIFSVFALFALGAADIYLVFFGPEEWHFWMIQNFGWAGGTLFLNCSFVLTFEYFSLKWATCDSCRMWWTDAPVLLMIGGVIQLFLAVGGGETFENPYLVARWEGAVILLLWGMGLAYCKRIGFRDGNAPSALEDIGPMRDND